MQDLLIKNVDDAVITRLKLQAEKEGETVEEIAKDILVENSLNLSSLSGLDERKIRFERWKQRLDQISDEIGPIQSDSTDHIREMRDSR